MERLEDRAVLATTSTVASLVGHGNAGTLRSAIAEANSGTDYLIQLSHAVRGTITWTRGELVLRDNAPDPSGPGVPRPAASRRAGPSGPRGRTWGARPGLAPGASAVHEIASRAMRADALGGSARAQTLYVSDYENGTIHRIASDGSVSTFVAGLDRPTGLAFHRAGTLYVSEVGTGSILKVTPRGRATTFVSGLNGPRDLAFDRSGNLYVSEVGTGTILKITPRGRVITFVSGLSEPSGNVIDAGGTLYQSNFLSGTIVKITPGGRVSLVDAVLDEPEDLVLDRAGTLYEADFGSGRIQKIAPDGTVSVFASGLSRPLGLAFDLAGTLYEADYGSGKIQRVAADGTVTTFVSGLGGPAYLAFAPGRFDAAGHRLRRGLAPRQTASDPAWCERLDRRTSARGLDRLRSGQAASSGDDRGRPGGRVPRPQPTVREQTVHIGPVIASTLAVESGLICAESIRMRSRVEGDGVPRAPDPPGFKAGIAPVSLIVARCGRTIPRPG